MSYDSTVVLRFGLISHIAFFFFKQKTAYEMRISDWSSDVCSSDLLDPTPVFDIFHLLGSFVKVLNRERIKIQKQWKTDRSQKRREELGRASCRERVCQYV